MKKTKKLIIFCICIILILLIAIMIYFFCSNFFAKTSSSDPIISIVESIHKLRYETIPKDFAEMNKQIKKQSKIKQELELNKKEIQQEQSRLKSEKEKPNQILNSRLQNTNQDIQNQIKENENKQNQINNKLSQIEDEINKEDKKLSKIRNKLMKSIQLRLFYISLIKIAQYKEELENFLIQAKKDLNITLLGQKNNLNSLICDINLVLCEMEFWLKEIDYPNLQNIQSFFAKKENDKYIQCIINSAFEIESEYISTKLPYYIKEIFFKNNEDILSPELKKFIIEQKNGNQKYVIENFGQNELDNSKSYIIKKESESKEFENIQEYNIYVYKILKEEENQTVKFVLKEDDKWDNQTEQKFREQFKTLLSKEEQDKFISENNFYNLLKSLSRKCPIIKDGVQAIKWKFPLGLQFQKTNFLTTTNVEEEKIVELKKFLNKIYYSFFENSYNYKINKLNKSKKIK